MKLLYIVHSLPFYNQAGTEVYTYELMREIAKRHEVYVLARVCDPKREEYELGRSFIDGINVFTINNTFSKCNSFILHYDNEFIDRKFERILEEIRPDLVHVQHLVFLSSGILKIVKNKGIPLVFTLHDYWLFCPKWHLLKNDFSLCNKQFLNGYDSECFNCIADMLVVSKNSKKLYQLSKYFFPASLVRLLRKAYVNQKKLTSSSSLNVGLLNERKIKLKVALGYVDVFLAPSVFMMEKFLASYGGLKETRLLRNGVRVNSLENRQRSFANGNIKLAYIGTILPAKGVHILIKAFKELKGNNLELVIYGNMRKYYGFEHYPGYLKNISRDDKRISFMPEFKHETVDKILQDIDILVVPSIWYENAPLVIQEALLNGIPVVASRIGGIPEMIQDEKNGLLFTPGDIEELKEKLVFLTNNPGLRASIANCRSPVKSIKEHSKEIESVYGEIVPSSLMKDIALSRN